MYLSDRKTETEVLRQGDIVGEIQLLGALNPANIKHIVDGGENSTYRSWIFDARPIFGFAMVLSHSCEVDSNNDEKVTSCILAPVRDINNATRPDKIKDLMNSNIVDQAGLQGSYLKYFCIDSHKKLNGFSSGGVVDFSKCFSVRRNYIPALTERKVLQLKPTVADQMALKLSLYFYRTQTT